MWSSYGYVLQSSASSRQAARVAGICEMGLLLILADLDAGLANHSVKVDPPRFTVHPKNNERGLYCFGLVCKWISNFIPHFTEHVITYPLWN